MAFVTRANLTEDALDIHMELGVALRFPAVARAIATQSDGAVAQGERVLR
jgi:hypothetical protein